MRSSTSTLCPAPLGHLGGIDAAVQPGGQAGVPQVVWPPGQGRGLLGRGEGQLARLDPGAAVGDGGQFAAPYAGEETAVVGRGRSSLGGSGGSWSARDGW